MLRQQRPPVPLGGRGLSAGGDPRSGAAFLLILVLAALLSAIVVAFLSLSSKRLALGTSDEAGKRAAALALLAQTNLIGNLKNEMAAGFANPLAPAQPAFLQVAGPAGPLNLLYPANAWSAVPARSGRLAPPNLVKWSTRAAPFYAESVPSSYPWRARFLPAQPASPVSTLDRSANGKVIPLKRWNATWLLPKKTPFSVDATPVPFPVPDWVCLNARGDQRNSLLTQRADPIVGRYAYLVFDEGGLLDTCVAGFDSRLEPAVVAAKASVRHADLRPLLEAGGLSPAEATACSNAFVQWRDPGFFANPALNYSNTLRFLAPPVPGALFAGNRALVSRQALIRMMQDRLPRKSLRTPECFAISGDVQPFFGTAKPFFDLARRYSTSPSFRHRRQQWCRLERTLSKPRAAFESAVRLGAGQGALDSCRWQTRAAGGASGQKAFFAHMAQSVRKKWHC